MTEEMKNAHGRERSSGEGNGLLSECITIGRKLCGPPLQELKTKA